MPRFAGINKSSGRKTMGSFGEITAPAGGILYQSIGRFRFFFELSLTLALVSLAGCSDGTSSPSPQPDPPHTWKGYGQADHSKDCPNCGAHLASRGDAHDCEALQKLNREEGWVDGIYGGRRVEDSIPDAPQSPNAPQGWDEEISLIDSNYHLHLTADVSYGHEQPKKSPPTTNEFGRHFKKNSVHYQVDYSVSGAATSKAKMFLGQFRSKHKGWTAFELAGADAAYYREGKQTTHYGESTVYPFKEVEALIVKEDAKFEFSLTYQFTTVNSNFLEEFDRNWNPEFFGAWKGLQVHR